MGVVERLRSKGMGTLSTKVGNTPGTRRRNSEARRGKAKVSLSYILLVLHVI